MVGKGYVPKLDVGRGRRFFAAGVCREEVLAFPASDVPVPPFSGPAGKITISGGVFNTSAIRSALAAAREYMVIRRDTAMTAFKIMVK